MERSAPGSFLQAPFVLEGLHTRAEEARAQGRRVHDLSLGSPPGRPPEHVLRVLEEALYRRQPNPHRRSPVRGLDELREAVAEWYERRFTVHLDPDREVLPSPSGLEALHLALDEAQVAGRAVLLPSPCPPSWISAVALAGAEPVFLPLRAEDGWRPRFDAEAVAAASGAKLMLLGSPHDPTGAIYGRDGLREAVAFCRDHGLGLVHEIRWCEFGLAEGIQPCSVLQLPGARECAIEISSPATSHRLSGWAPGLLAGAPERIDALARRAGHRGPGPFLAVQMATVAALTGDDSFLAEQRRELRLRQERLREGLGRLGWEIPPAEGTIFLWSTLPPGKGSNDLAFADEFFAATEVLLAPGSAFGPGGEGHLRWSLCVDSAGIDACLSSIEESGFLS